MKVLNDLRELGEAKTPVIFTVGSFDGIHRGHQALIQTAQSSASAVGGEAWVLTFDPHPLKVLKPEMAPALLTCTPHKLNLMRRHGVEGCVVMKFDAERSQQEPEDFLRELGRQVPTLREVIVGRNWRFGHGARGDTALLEKMAPDLGIKATVLEPVCNERGPISSSRVRAAVTSGNLDEAAGMLGRPFSVLGEVVHGRNIGKGLGFPTANICPDSEVRPPAGIYAVRAEADGVPYQGAGYIGKAATVGAAQSDAVVEVYLFDVDLDLYGHELEVYFVAHLRDDRKFPSTAELQEQIRLDVQTARSVLSEDPPV